jgi:hypothetical protein
MMMVHLDVWYKVVEDLYLLRILAHHHRDRHRTRGKMMMREEERIGGVV